MRVAHLAFDLSLRHEGRHRIDDDQIDRPAPDKRVDDLEGLLAVVGLRDEELVRVHATDPGPAGIERVLRVNEGRGPTAALHGSDGMQRERGLSRRFLAVDLDDPAARIAADAERQIER